MSLKAKLEAVIYAAEEPVTLAQLAALFADEALEWKAEQEAAAAQAPADAESAAPLPLLSEEASASGTEQASDAAPEPPAQAEAVSAEEAVAEQEAAEPAAEDPAAAEAETRRLARLRDREIKAVLRQLLDEIVAEYATETRGVEIREIAGGFRMATKPEYHDAVRSFVKSLKPALKLSLPALETLAVIAYKQPITAPEVNEIRGVDSSGVFGSLLARKLIATAGRKQVIGRPILYKTTKEFLLRFGLKDITELPSMEEFEKMAAAELEEPELTDGSEPAGSGGDQAPELDENASEEAGETAAIEAQEPAAEQRAETETPEDAESAAPEAASGAE